MDGAESKVVGFLRDPAWDAPSPAELHAGLQWAPGGSTVSPLFDAVWDSAVRDVASHGLCHMPAGWIGGTARVLAMDDRAAPAVDAAERRAPAGAVHAQRKVAPPAMTTTARPCDVPKKIGVGVKPARQAKRGAHRAPEPVVEHVEESEELHVMDLRPPACISELSDDDVWFICTVMGAWGLPVRS